MLQNEYWYRQITKLRYYLKFCKTHTTIELVSHAIVIRRDFYTEELRHPFQLL